MNSEPVPAAALLPAGVARRRLPPLVAAAALVVSVIVLLPLVFLVVQAVQVASFGPLAWCRILTCPAARFTIAEGIKNGDILRGPPLSRFECSRSMTSNPPIPEPMLTPVRSAMSSFSTL